MDAADDRLVSNVDQLCCDCVDSYPGPMGMRGRVYSCTAYGTPIVHCTPNSGQACIAFKYKYFPFIMAPALHCFNPVSCGLIYQSLLT